MINKTAPGIAGFDAAYTQLLKVRPGVLASEGGGELAWLRQARDRDAKIWRSSGLPTRRDENWKYVSLASMQDATILFSKEFSLAQLPPREQFASLPVENAVEIVFMNGHFLRSWSKMPAQSGLQIEALSEILEECVEKGWSAERLQKFAAFQHQVENADGDRETVFSAMNTSFMPDALLISVAPHIAVTDPIVIYHFTSSDGATANDKPLDKSLEMAAPRIFVEVKEKAELALMEFFSGDAAHPYLNTSVSDIRVAHGARLSYCNVQLEGSEAYHIATTRIHQAKDSWVETQQLSFGGKLSRHDLHLSLEGEGAEARVDGLYLTDGQQVVDNHTSIDHLVPNTMSRQLYKGILAGQSRAVFNGRVKIAKDAQKSNSSQLNNNLMLSSKAEVDTKPELAIFADDVKAAHGATIGQMDPEHLFYLQSRAIGKDQAMLILARGFALEVVYRIQNNEMREQLLKLVTREMDQKLGETQ